MSRPRGLRYSRDPLARRRLPRFPEPDYPERRDPFDGGSWDRYAEDPKPLSWADLTPANFVGGLLMFLAIAAFIVAASVIGWQP